VPIATEHDHARPRLVDVHAVAVEFLPRATSRRWRHFLGAGWAAGLDETERGHASGCRGIAPVEQGYGSDQCRRSWQGGSYNNEPH